MFLDHDRQFAQQPYLSNGSGIRHVYPAGIGMLPNLRCSGGCRKVALVMTFTPEPPSMIRPKISSPCRITLMIRFWWSTTVGPVVDFVKFARIITEFIFHICASNVCRNLGIQLNILSIIIVIWPLARACHIGSSFVIASSVHDVDVLVVLRWRIRSTFASLAFSTHAFEAFRMPSWTPQSDAFAWLRVVT